MFFKCFAKLFRVPIFILFGMLVLFGFFFFSFDVRSENEEKKDEQGFGEG